MPIDTAADFDAILFDCDGTLVDSEAPGMDVLHQVGQDVGVVFTREVAHAAFRGQSMEGCIRYITSRMSANATEALSTWQAAAPELPLAELLTRQVREQQFSRFRQHLQVIAGAHELLANLRQPVCVATNGPRAKAELTLGLTGLLPHFIDAHGDRLFTAYEVGHFKPEPGLFLHAAQALGAAPARCAVVEDSLPGVLAGLAAGMRVFAIGGHEPLPAAVAAQVRHIADLHELDALLHG